jgi:hypothetical protein
MSRTDDPLNIARDIFRSVARTSADFDQRRLTRVR